MDAACIRHTEIPHTSKLFVDFQYHYDRVKEYYGGWPGDPASFSAAARQIDFPDSRRAALVQALRARGGDSASLDLLAKPGTVAVVTGQQVGLFGGPAYTIYKALSAVRLARQLTDQGQPAVPVFWVATEDHDLAEVNHCFVFGPEHQPVRLETPATGNGQSVGQIAVGDAPFDKLAEILEPFPFGAEIGRRTTEAYRGQTLGSAFERLLRGLLQKWDLLYVDPLDPALRAIAAPLLQEALARAPELKASLLERNRALEKAGYHAQVLVEPQTSLLFLLENGRRVTLHKQNGEYASKDRRYSQAELEEHAASLSPNALLRPVMQDYLLPTVAYVGGPAEIAYFAQSEVIYRALLGRMPVVMARSSFTLLDARAHKLMNRYGVGLPCFFHGEECLREKIAAKLIPASLSGEFQEIERVTSASLEKLQSSLLAFDPTLAAALDKSGAKIRYQLSKMERKAASEALRRDQRATAESEYLMGAVLPNRHLQERYYSILPFLAQHGPQLLDTLFEAIHLDCPDHRILTI